MVEGALTVQAGSPDELAQQPRYTQDQRHKPVPYPGLEHFGEAEASRDGWFHGMREMEHAEDDEDVVAEYDRFVRDDNAAAT